MVMIPVGNRTRHNFGLWCIVEMYIRFLISAVVLYRVAEVVSSPETQIFLKILFCVWSMRPVYYQFKCLYGSWIDAKHRSKQ